MLLVRHPTTYLEERSYVLNVVLREFLGLDFTARGELRTDVQISLAEISDGADLAVCEGLFATPEPLWLTRESLPDRPLASWSLRDAPIAPRLVEQDLPIIYGTKLPAGSFYEEVGDSNLLGLDVFGSIFFQLTRYEEIADPSRDEHGRFPPESSLAHGEGFLNRPLVNEYVEVLWTALERLWPSLRRRRRAFSERPSHDVDWPLHTPLSPPRMARAAIGDLVRRRDAGLVRARLRARRARRRGDPSSDPYFAFEFIMDTSERRGLRSAFYFQAGRTDPRFDATYSLDDTWIGALIRRIHERGHEVGLHPSYGTFRDAIAIRAEREALVRTCKQVGVVQSEWGGRQHFLRWENPTTWRGWEQAALAYDSSLGFPHHAGFRCGVCFEYPVFDLLDRRRRRLRERPLIAMEMALFDGSPASEARGLETLAQLRSRCKLFDGDFTLLWHNSRLASTRERRLYLAALARD
jgi:Family of unknown function (DUF7033)